MSRDPEGDSGATLSVPDSVNEEEFFTDDEGGATLVDHADLVKTVQEYDASEIPHLEERARGWLYRPYSFHVIYENVREDEHRYLVVEPWLDDTEEQVLEMLKEKVPTTITPDTEELAPSKPQRIQAIRRKSRELLQRYGYLSRSGSRGLVSRLVGGGFRDAETSFSEEQVERIQYYLLRDYINYRKIEPLRHDVNIEDISCNGPNERTFVDHAQFGEIITNVSFDEDELQQFVKDMAGKAGKGISKRQPEVDARLPDGSRAKLILGTEINEKGSSFTIREFKEVPFTPVDLISWNTFSLEQMAYLWLAIEHGKSGIIAGGTSSGKTTTMNACSLFMPGNQKVVTIEDTPELKLPQANWVSHTTRESFHAQETNSYSAYRLLKGALRENPDYLIMGEVRGREDSNEGKTLFQLMSTGHWTYTTFHADSPQELINRFTSDPINVSPTQFASLDFITIQRQRSIYGTKVRRAESITEVGEWDKDRGETSVSTVYEWDPTDDMFHQRKDSALLDEIRYENGWREEDLDRELELRKIVLGYLVYHRINTYAAVAATLQAYMAKPEKVLSLIANNDLKEQLGYMVDKDYINIDVDEAQEARVPRPAPDDHLEHYLRQFLESREHLLEQFVDLDAEVADEEMPDREGIVVTSPGIQQTGAAAGQPAIGPTATVHPPLEGEVGGQPGGGDPGVDLEPHLGLASGEYRIEDGEIRQAIREAEAELEDLYDDAEEESLFGDIVDEADESGDGSLEDGPEDSETFELIKETVEEVEQQTAHGKGASQDGEDSEDPSTG